MKTVGIIGYGAIGRYVASHIAKTPEIALTHVVVRPSRQTETETLTVQKANVISSVSHIEHWPDIMIDCAGHEGLREHGAAVLSADVDLITVSVGALADTQLFEMLTRAATQSKGTLHLASGAIGALDALSAASVGGLDSVIYRGMKPPSGWLNSPAEQVLNLAEVDRASIHFSGTAREAALAYPKNANVAASVALAGIGFEKTVVELVADPALSQNIHEIQASGEFGQFSFRIQGNALPDNPKSSALTAMSVVRKVLALDASVVQ